MKKFNDILNENLEGEYNNAIAVDLIVKEYDLIRNFLCKYIIGILNKDDVELVTKAVDISQLSTILYNKEGDPYLKYLGIYISIDLNAMFDLRIDVVDYFTSKKDILKESFSLKDDALRKGRSTHDFYIQIDYDKFLKSDLFKSLKGINKFNL